MTGECPHLAYRTGDGDRGFETPRAYCTVAGRFVRPVRADTCNARYELSPREHCELYRDHEDVDDGWPSGARDGGADTDRSTDDATASDPDTGSDTSTGSDRE
jgi:hypothetical protein